MEKVKSPLRDIPIPKRCQNCPYPKTGLVCRDRDGGCTRVDMAELRSSQKRADKKGGRK